MQHCALFSSALTTGQTNTDVNLVADQYLTKGGDNKALLKKDMRLVAAYAFGTGFDKGRIIAPSLKKVSYPRLPLFEQVTVPADLPAICRFDDNPPIIRRNESFNFQADNTDAGTQTENVIAFLVDQIDPIPPGPSFVLYGTVTVTTIAYQWVSGVITWEDTYPPVPFALIGLRVVGTNLLAARVIPVDGGPRPGVIGTATERTDDRSLVWNGSMGKLAEFTPPQFPQFEFAGQTAAATAFRVYAQVVPLQNPQ